MVPSPTVRQELETLILGDESRLGDVYRGNLARMTAEDLAESLGVATSNFVWNYTQLIAALLEGKLPESPTMALAVARKFRSFLRVESLSYDARRYLSEQLNVLESKGSDVEAAVAEATADSRAVNLLEAKVQAGIYVYALPHYLRHPFDAPTGRTLLKVGMSERDIIQRFREQTRTTALPEEPVLLRIYSAPPNECSTLEKQFHSMMEAADHNRSVSRSAGREWFVTSTKFLDQFARALGLPIHVIKEAADFSE